MEGNTSYEHEYENRLDQDTHILTNIFPLEIWNKDIVSTHLASNPNDVETLANSSPYFREMLMDKRVLFLARKVLKVFCKWVFEEVNKWHVGELDEEEEGYEFGDLLKLRQVCSTWNLAVDDLVEEQFQNWNVIVPDGIIETREHITKFAPHFTKTHPPSNSRTPFIGNLLLVDTRFQDEMGHYWDEFLALLKVYGHYIWHLKFVTVYGWTLNGLTDEQFYLKFREMLGLLPNLQSLWLEWEDIDLRGSEFVQLHPIPKLVYLTNLKIGDCPDDIFACLLRENGQLSSINLNFKDDEDLILKMEHLEEEPNDLHFPFSLAPPPTPSFEFGSATTSPPNFRRQLCQQVNTGISHCQLAKLTLEIPTDMSSFNWNEIFNVISVNWGSNLEYLKLVLPISNFQECFRNSLECRLHLPKVKELELKTDLNAISIDFLLEMQSLNIARISSITQETSHFYRKFVRETILKDSKGAIVKFIGRENEMYKSNIWSQFKNLDILEVEGILYRRSSWHVNNVQNIREAWKLSWAAAKKVYLSK